MRRPHFADGGIKHATVNGHRLHLRTLDPTRESYLWIDGRQPPLVLDRTAADFVAHLIDALWLHQRGDGDETGKVVAHVVERMFATYGARLPFGRGRVTRARIRSDLDRIFGTILQIAADGCPLAAGLPEREIRIGSWAAPARMDLAITYACNLSCQKCYNGSRSERREPLGRPGQPERPELSEKEWREIYAILWKLGIPQVVFTGGEPTLRADLVALVEEADEFVTGLITNGTRLADLARPLRDASLDYVQVTIESFDPSVHDAMTGVPGSHAQTVLGLRAALDAGLAVVTNTTLARPNALGFGQTLGWLSEIGVQHAACNTLICSGRGVRYRQEQGLPDAALQPVLAEAVRRAEDAGLDLQWYSPTCYTQGIDPLALGFGVKACSAAAHNMLIEPDGSVLPCQSWSESVGNILRDDWSAIWEHPVCRGLRDHVHLPATCRDCRHRATCAGACPLDESPRRCEEVH